MCFKLPITLPSIVIASVISLDCDEGVCPLVNAVASCQVSSIIVRWVTPALGAVSEGVPTREDNGYTAMYIGNGVSTLTFNATTDKNTTVVECEDPLDTGPSVSCTVIIAG